MDDWSPALGRNACIFAQQRRLADTAWYLDVQDGERRLRRQQGRSKRREFDLTAHKSASPDRGQSIGRAEGWNGRRGHGTLPSPEGRIRQRWYIPRNHPAGQTRPRARTEGMAAARLLPFRSRLSAGGHNRAFHICGGAWYDARGSTMHCREELPPKGAVWSGWSLPNMGIRIIFI